MRLGAAIILFCLVAGAARAADIAIALTDDLVEVNAGFAGEKVVLFGALTGDDSGAAPGSLDDYDIVAVLRGPIARFRIRPMIRERFIWIAGPAIDIAAPEILLTSATRNLDKIAAPAVLRRLGVTTDANTLSKQLSPSPAGETYLRARGAMTISKAFLDHARRTGRFREFDDAVKFRKGALFSINLELAPATPVGEYAVDVFLFRQGGLISRDTATLSVKKVGIERSVYEIAHDQPLAYGLGCLVIALAAGWLAAAAFRK